MSLSLEGLLQDLVARGGSDLHLVHASPPCMRVAGKVTPATSTPLDSAMISKDTSIKTLFQRKEITRETALAHMRNPDLLGI